MAVSANWASLRWAFITLLAFALPESARTAELVNRTADNIAIQGYDAVAYFTEGRPVVGLAEFEHSWQEAIWRFAKAEHLRLFIDNPLRYAPRYGGFCAGAMALGWRSTVDPEAWAIVEDRLYLFYDRQFVGEFVENAADRIESADENWRSLGGVGSQP